MTPLLELAPSVMSGAAGFHDHDGARIADEEGEESRSLQALASADVAGVVGHRDLQDGLCNVDGNGDIVLHDGLLLLPKQQRLWHIDADQVAEESISSLKLTRSAMVWTGAALAA